MSHSILPPSSAGIWGKPDGCPGWVLMSQQVPDIQDPQKADEGEVAHEIGASMILAAMTANKAQLPPTAEKLVGTVAANGATITEEMFDAADLYADDIIAEMYKRHIFGGPDIGVEERIEIPRVHSICYGTPDCYLYDKRKKKLIIWDFKYGRILIEAFENWQGICYAAGLLDKLGINGIEDQQLTVEIRIIQPRAPHRLGPIRSWSVTASDLRGKFNILNYNAILALSPEAKLHSGSHCRYCHCRYDCPAAIDSGLGLYEITTDPIPVNASINTVSLTLQLVQRAREQLKALESGYEEQVKALIRSGKNVPRWMLEPTLGRERWAKSPGEVKALGAMMGIDLQKTDALVTPNQARKLGLSGDIVAAYSEIPNNGLKLVLDNGSLARKVFQP